MTDTHSDVPTPGPGGLVPFAKPVEKPPMAYKEFSAVDVKKMWGDADRLLLADRRNYWLNVAFAEGEQWIEWDTQAGIPQLISRFESNAEKTSRSTINKIRSRRRNLVSRLVRNELTFEVTPSGSDDVSLARQRIEEQILEACRREDNWEGIRQEEVEAMLDGGHSAICWEWDPEAGEQLQVPDQETGQLIRFGSVKLTALSNIEFCLETGARSVADARWWIRATTLTPEQAQERYDLKSLPVADSLVGSSPTGRQMRQRRYGAGGSPEVCSLYVLYHRPTVRHPGCVVHVLGNQVVEHSEWKFPFDSLNIAVFVETGRSGSWTGSTLVSDARQVQYQYNKARTVQASHADKAANARILAAAGSLEGDDPFSDQVGEIVEFHPDQGVEPHWMEAPDMSRGLGFWAGELESELDDIFSTYAIARGEQVGDRNSGSALGILAERADSPLGPTGKNQATGWSTIGKRVLQMLKQRAHELDEAGVPVPEITYEDDSRTPIRVSWTGDDIDDEPRVRVPLDVAVPRSRAAQQAAVIQIAQSFPKLFESIDQDALSRMLAMPTARGGQSVDANTQMAKYENVMLRQGEPMTPAEWHNHAAHLHFHNEERNRPSYDSWPPESQQLMAEHIARHEQAQEQEQNEARQKMAAQIAAAQQGQLPGGPPQGQPPMELPPGSGGVTE